MNQFVVYALDAELRLPPGLTRAQQLDAIKGHVIGQGAIAPIYERKGSTSRRLPPDVGAGAALCESRLRPWLRSRAVDVVNGQVVRLGGRVDWEMDDG